MLVGVVLLGLAAPVEAADLALKRVVLSTGGVGYFEYEARVEGNATLALDVPLDQVDDVLKSLAIYDSAGSAGEVTLPGREPLAQSLSDLPFDRAALNSLIDLLNALQGAEIKVSAPKAVSGRLLHVDQEVVRDGNGTAQTRARVSVMTEAGLQQFLLHEVEAIAFADPTLQRQVDTALQRIAAYRAAARRELTLHVRGSGERAVRVGYVVAMPLWKASYRLGLPGDMNAKSARLQGWAVLENFSGRAWNDVSLTLLSGNPVTFRQALYESYYVPRQTVPVESGRHVLPPPDTGTVAHEPRGREERAAFRSMDQAAVGGAMAKSAAAPPPPPAPQSLARIDAASAAEEATQVAFTLPEKVNVPAGQSLMVPLLDRELPARRVDLYQPSVDGRRPLAAVELTNDSGTGLPPGVLTLYQQGAGDGGAVYLGDARLAALPAGDKRLLSYAIDNKVTVDRETEERRPIVKATIADGVMKVNRAIHFTTRYRIKSASTPPPQMLIEQNRRGGATLTAPDPKNVELTANAYRIPFTIPTGGSGTLAVVEEQPIQETIRITDLDDNRLGTFVSSTELDPKLRQALGEVASRRQAVARQRAELNRLKEERGQLVEDEKRVRENLRILGNEAAMKKRLLDKFNETQTAIETVSAAQAKTSEALAAAEKELAAYVAGLTL
jgi:hypothetical protein